MISRRAFAGGVGASALSVGGLGTALADRETIAVSDLADLFHVAPRRGAVVLVRQSGRGGRFVWDDNDHTQMLQADPLRGMSHPGSADPSGRRGAWRRINRGHVEPEWFGAVGDGVSDDSLAMRAMAEFGRAVGTVHVRLTPGKTYTYKGPYLLAGIRRLIVDGRGAALMNIAGGDKDETFYSNYEGLVFPSIFNSNNATDYGGSRTPHNLGVLIETANRGERRVRLKTLDPAFVVGGRVLVYGFDGLGVPDGFPPCPRFFEYHGVAAVEPDAVVLSTPLAFDYDSRWGDLGTRVPCGRPRIVSADRTDFVQIEHLELRDLHIRSFAGWTAPGATTERNGRLTIAGYDHAILRGVVVDGGLYVSQGGTARIESCRIATTVETDKCVEKVVYRKTSMGKHILGNGSRFIDFIDCRFAEGLVANPIERLRIIGGRLVSKGGQKRQYIGLYGGVREIEVRGTTFSCQDEDKESVLPLFSVALPVIAVSPAGIMWDRSEYTAVRMARFVRVGDELLGEDGRAAFVVDKMPYEADGAVKVEGRFLRPFSVGETLSCGHFKKVTLTDITREGPFAHRFTTLPLRRPPSEVAFDIVDDDRASGWWRVRSGQMPIGLGPRPFLFGREVVLSDIVISVEAAAAPIDADTILKVRHSGLDIATANLATPGQTTLKPASGPLNRIDIRIMRANRDIEARGARWTIEMRGRSV